MNNRRNILIGLILVILSCIMIVLSYMYNQTLLIILFIILILVSTVFLILTMALDIFRRDKILDIEALKSRGLTIIACKECGKENVLEDIFCIFCGDKLGEENERI